MDCPYLESGRCNVAEKHVRDELDLAIECRPEASDCSACIASGQPCEERPSIACIGLVTKQLPPDRKREWKKYVGFLLNGESRGLGDTIAKVTKATGIDKVVGAIAKATGKDCGCKKRQKKLNAAAPYSAPSQ